MFILLYLGGIFLNFSLASISYLVISIITLLYLIVSNRTTIFSPSHWKLSISSWKSEKTLFLVILISLIFVYAAILMTRPLLDSDVIQYYLPFSREIVRSNGFTYSTGYDYNTFLKPIGVSVIYAWTYIVSGSIYLEPFRLMPLIPVIMLVLTTFEISKVVSGKDSFGYAAAIVFMLLPLHDRLLYYNAFYPDVFYYPLIFSIILYVVKYSKDRDSRYLLWIGLAFGIAGLIKAQTILFVIASLLCLVSVEIKSKKIVFLICLITPLFILVPNLFAEIGDPNSIIFSLGPERVALLLFASIIAAFTYIVLEPNIRANLKRNSNDKATAELDNGLPQTENFNVPSILKDFTTLISRSLFIIIPFILLASLWYINNLIRFGSLIYTSNISIPNYEWADDILRKILQSNNQLSYVMGYIWLIPLAFGLVFLIKNKTQNLSFLLFFSIISVILIYSQTVYYASTTSPYATNPRDLIPIAPMLSIIAVYGIARLVQNHSTSIEKMRIKTMTYVIVAFYGLASYLHSVYIYFGGAVFNSLWIYKLLTGFLSLFGLTLQQTSFQLWTIDRISFITQYPLSILALSLVIAIPLIIISFMKHGLPKVRKIVSQITRAKDGWFHTRLPAIKFVSLPSTKKDSLKAIGLLLMFIIIIILPRAVIITTQSGLQNSRNYQMSMYYGPLHELLIDDGVEMKGDILTFAAPPGIQYYLPNINVIDLRYSANLAHLRPAFNSTNPFDIASNLRATGIRYLLFNLNTFSDLDNILNNSLGSIMSNISLSVENGKFGNWVLYSLGPFEISREVFPLSNWELDDRYVSGPVSLENNGSMIALNLTTGSSGSRIAIKNYKIPHLNLSEYNYISFKICGTNNSRVLIRFYLNNNTPLDFAYWNSPDAIDRFDFGSYSQNSFRGDAFVSVISNNEQPAIVYLKEIAVVKLIPVSSMYIISHKDWSLDSRNTIGDVNFTKSHDSLKLELNQGLSGDRLSVYTQKFPEINLTEVNYLKVDLSGSLNTRILFRAYLANGNSIDLVYWVSPDFLRVLIPIPNLNIAFRGDAYLAIASNDGTPCSIVINEIVLVNSGQ